MERWSETVSVYPDKVEVPHGHIRIPTAERSSYITTALTRLFRVVHWATSLIALNGLKRTLND